MKVGILGGGQLGRMLALAAHPLGLQTRIVEPKPDCPAAGLAPTLSAPFDAPEALAELSACDVVTYENENVAAEVVARLAESRPVRPSPAALEMTRDRLPEKQGLRRFGLDTAEFRAVDSRADLDSAVEALGLPARLKTRRFGYDGKGQLALRRPADLDAAWRRLGGQSLILEQHVDFQREVSLLAVRGLDGAMRFWPPTENVHIDGILHLSRAPAREIERRSLRRVQRRVEALARSLDYVGVLAVELFLAGGQWIANEVACRVHNSGHWTLEGAQTSQFENHLRAIVGWPLGSTRGRGPAAMLNLLGELPEPQRVLSVPGAHLHSYAKASAPGRKLGHVTVCASTHRELDRRLQALIERLPLPALAEPPRGSLAPGAA